MVFSLFAKDYLTAGNSLFARDSVFLEESGDGNFGTIYMILVFAIAALLLILIVKPMYQQAQKTIPKASGS